MGVYSDHFDLVDKVGEPGCSANSQALAPKTWTTLKFKDSGTVWTTLPTYDGEMQAELEVMLALPNTTTRRVKMTLGNGTIVKVPTIIDFNGRPTTVTLRFNRTANDDQTGLRDITVDPWAHGKLNTGYQHTRVWYTNNPMTCDVFHNGDVPIYAEHKIVRGRLTK